MRTVYDGLGTRRRTGDDLRLEHTKFRPVRPIHYLIAVAQKNGDSVKSTVRTHYPLSFCTARQFLSVLACVSFKGNGDLNLLTRPAYGRAWLPALAKDGRLLFCFHRHDFGRGIQSIPKQKLDLRLVLQGK